MKRNLILISILVAMLGFTSCNDWLDVRPKSQILAEDHFSREAGFHDQIIGVLTMMGSEYMYGREMTFGLMEVLAQTYDLEVNNAYRYAVRYEFMHPTVRPRIDRIWNNTFNAIANLNVMLEFIEKADPNIFRDNNRKVFEGEALGLRAFLHFDMLRIFAPSYAYNPSALAIPYVTTTAPVVTPTKTVSEALDFIIADLDRAIALLEYDTIRSRETWTPNRRAFFNYYAAITTLARVHMWRGDHDNALKYAEMIIAVDESAPGNRPFSWTHYSARVSTEPRSRNRLFTPEMIFYLRITNMADLVNPWFRAGPNLAANVNALTLNEVREEYVFELHRGLGSDDRRFFTTEGPVRYLSKFWQGEDWVVNNHMPLIRKTEAYYIAAEIHNARGNHARAVELLNIVRSHRSIDAHPLDHTSLTPSEIQEEIFKEYRKEFLGEGQLFFYFKRRNEPIIGSGMPATNTIFVLPMPDNEMDFGFRR